MTTSAAATAHSLNEADSMIVVPWRDELVERVGHSATGSYVERFWLGTVGPTAAWLLRLLAARLQDEPSGYELDLASTAASLGIGWAAGRTNPMNRALHRLTVFGLAQVHGSTVAVRLYVPPLAQRQIARLPEHLQIQHAVWQNTPKRPHSSGTTAASAVRERRS